MRKELWTMSFTIFLKSHPSMAGPEVVVCTGGSGARFSTLGAGEGAGEVALARSEPLSLENFT